MTVLPKRGGTMLSSIIFRGNGMMIRSNRGSVAASFTTTATKSSPAASPNRQQHEQRLQHQRQRQQQQAGRQQGQQSAVPRVGGASTAGNKANNRNGSGSPRAAAGGGGGRIPPTHSKKAMPAVCSDPTELNELTQQILEAPVSSLFSYVPGKDSRTSAWIAADHPVQKIEYVLRGHSLTIPETQWSRWCNGNGNNNGNNNGNGDANGRSESDDADRMAQTVRTMDALISRLWDEGEAYMSARDEGLERRLGPKQPGKTLSEMKREAEEKKREMEQHRALLRSSSSSSSSAWPSPSSEASSEDHRDDDDLDFGNIFQDAGDDDEVEITYGRGEDDGGGDEGEGTAGAVGTMSGSEASTQQRTSKIGVGNREEARRFVEWCNKTGETVEPEELERMFGEDGTRWTYMDDFALPGPTVHMYNTLLDSMACVAAAAASSSSSRLDPILAPRKARLLLCDVEDRHEMDGGYGGNDNAMTRADVMSYNAAMRAASSVPYRRTNGGEGGDGDPTLRRRDVAIRDDAVELAFGSFAELECRGDEFLRDVISKNSATYRYLLDAVSKFFPPSKTKINVSSGIFHHARESGLVDAGVVSSYLRAVEDDESGKEDEFTQHIVRILREKDVKELPERWRRFSRARRYRPDDATY